MEKVEIDTTRIPVVVVTFPEVMTPDAYIALFERYVELSSQHDRLAYIIDFRAFDPVHADAATRKAAANTFAQNKHILAPVTVCEARIVESAISRGILTAFDWLTAGKWPCDNFATAEEAERWVARQLANDHRASGDAQPRV